VRKVLVLLLAAVASVTAVPAAHAATVSRYSITVDGENALGWLALPADPAPTKLLVFGHGCCGKPDQSGMVAAYADAYGAVAVAMDYRGPGGWDVMKGHRDLIAATEDLKARFPSITRTVLWGISMGGETTGMAVAARPDLFDYWVDTFGVVDLFQEFAALGLYPGVGANPNDPANPTSSWMIAETGGTPATVPDAYLARSPAYSAASMHGIKRAYISHGVGDLIVQYSQSRLMYTNLVANGIPVTLDTVLTRGGAIQGPFVPAQGFPSVPTPYALSSHDGSAQQYSNEVVHYLLLGQEPDSGTAFREWIVDATTGTRVAAPPV
jgi:dipeptidyl aminopeptidase/acylaminoacyl peptidase